MTIIGLTGGIAAGKSEVSAVLRRAGCLIIDADDINRENLRRGGAAFDGVAEAFGADILGPDGEIDRKRLGAAVFGDREKLDLLSGLTHGHVLARVREILAGAEGKYAYAVIDAALLIESGADGLCDGVWLVTAPLEERIDRLARRDGFTREGALRRIRSRLGDEVLARKATEIIENNGTLSELNYNIRELLCRLS